MRYLHHLETRPPETLTRKENKAYYRIANHYNFIMRTFFDCFGYPRLILLEVGLADSPLQACSSRLMSRALPLHVTFLRSGLVACCDGRLCSLHLACLLACEQLSFCFP